jgi:tetratricopeptide (TPR) repeat protein
VVIGRELGNLQEWALAEMALVQATEVDPNYSDAWAFLGEARQQVGGDGLAELQTAYEIDPDSIAVNSLMSLYWRRRGQYDLAIEYLQGAIESDEGSPTLIAELGNLYAEAGNLPEAQSLYLQAIELAPWDPTFWKLLAELSFMSQASIRDHGLPAARQTLYLDRDDPYAMDLLGRMLMLLGDNITAERFFRKALSYDPGFFPARLHLGQVLLNLGEFDSAIIQLELVIELGLNSEEAQHAERLLQSYFP